MNPTRRFTKVLVANRGEIAIRLLRACREMGLRTVAIFSEADRESLHLEHADEAYCIGPPPSSESYLRIDKIIEVAKKSGADAIHPGYGFLAERSAFPRAVREAGIVFIGPSPESMDALGEKVAARNLMKKFGVPTIPGTETSIGSAAEAGRIAVQFGFPVLLKAAGGGGGKGMRIVHHLSEMEGAFQQATNEARKAFGNPDVFIEKYISPARHIEIQVLGDSHGNYIHLGERECTVQRRFQKLLEETPSPFVDEKMRLAMGQTAVTACREMKYLNAGTFEFVVDSEKNYYFLEVNTRLQVEHPVTELVTQIDIVKEMIRVAMGDPLSPEAIAYSKNPKPMGHAIECRINAESAQNNFAPSTGRIHFVRIPDGPGIRIDRSVRGGSVVSMFYDSMIAKLIAWGRTREEAIARMNRALSEFEVHGVDTTLDFHRWMVNHPRFQSNEVHTKFVEEEFTADQLEGRSSLELLAATAALLHHFQSREREAAPGAEGAAAPGEQGNGGRDDWKMTGRLAATGRIGR